MHPIVSIEVNARRNKRRSRFGCRNCKLRKLKCDEKKPQCKRCSAFRVLCNFTGSQVPDLQPLANDVDGDIKHLVLNKVSRPQQLRPPPSSLIWTADSSEYSYQLDARCQDFVTKYLGRSLVNPDDPILSKVNRRLLRLSFEHPFLMHACLAVALAYDRFLDAHTNTSISHRRNNLIEECHHRSQSNFLFNKMLQSSLDKHDKDAIWATAAALAILSFSAPAGTWLRSEEPWPLKSCFSDSEDFEQYGSKDETDSEERPISDLQWILVKEGKMSLWNFTNPLRPDSIFSIMAPIYAQMYIPLPRSGIDGIPSPLAIICNIGDNSHVDNRGTPFFTPAHALSQLLRVPDEEITVGHTEMFMNTVQGVFRALLITKDPVALLLLYLWYRKAGRCIWWVALRARVEMPAICTYLRLYHVGDAEVQEFLPGGRWGNEAWLIGESVSSA